MATATKSKRKSKKETATIHIGLLLDESGSMGGKEQAVVEGTNEFIGSLQGEKNSDRTRVTLAMFDERPGAPRVRVKRAAEKLDEVELLAADEYGPQGMTPLNDAIMETISSMEQAMAGTDSAMLVIFTDGYENASETDTATVKAAIEKKEADGWTVIYLGANVDAQKVGSSLSTNHATSFTSTAKGTSSAMRGVAAAGAYYVSEGGTIDSAALNATLGKEIAEDGTVQSTTTSKPVAKKPTESKSSASRTARDALRSS